MNLLEINNLKTYFRKNKQAIKAVDGINFTVSNGESLGIVGESGCGKSVTALSILRLISKPGKIIAGEIYFKGENLLKKSKTEMNKIRGREISMIFQNPSSSLNPSIVIGEQIAEVIRLHKGLSRHDAKIEAKKELELVGVPIDKINNYPHQLSGGMCQRVMIALACSCDPSLLLADEPTTSLDTITQAQILDLLNNLINENRMSMIIMTHDFGVVSELCDKVAVMYMGKIMESGKTKDIFNNPCHPYTQALLTAIINPNPNIKRTQINLQNNEVVVNKNYKGCQFAPKCPNKTKLCIISEPPLIPIKNGHTVSCHNLGIVNLAGVAFYRGS